MLETLRRRREDRPQRFKRGVYVVPAMFTVGNLFCGYACLVYSMRGDFDTAAVLIGVAMVLDTLDGFFARLTRPSRLKIQPEQTWQSMLPTGGIRLGLFLLAASAIANVLGFVSLSQILGVGTLFSVFIFALLYTMVRVLNLSIVIIVNSVWFQSLDEGRSEDIERFGRRRTKRQQYARNGERSDRLHRRRIGNLGSHAFLPVAQAQNVVATGGAHRV